MIRVIHRRNVPLELTSPVPGTTGSARTAHPPAECYVLIDSSADIVIHVRPRAIPSENSMGFDFTLDGSCFYVPSAFYIHVSEPVFDDEDRAQPDTWYKMMHEYAHLIQDRTTLFGALEFILFWDFARGIVQLIKEEARHRVIPLPLRSATSKSSKLPTARCQVEANYGLRDLIRQANAWNNNQWWAYDGHKTIVKMVEFGGHQIPYNVAVVRFADNATDEVMEHTLGPKEIKEAYSTAVQLVHGGDEISTAAQFEYLAVERVLAQFGRLQPGHVVAICHWSLQHASPGVRFFEIVDLMKESHIADSISPFDLYDLLRDSALVSGYPENVTTWIQQMREIVEIQSATGTSDTLFRVLQWYHRHVSIALERNANKTRRFPIDTCLCSSPIPGYADSFARLVAEEPIPVVTLPGGRLLAFGDEEDGLDTTAGLLLRSLADLTHHLWSSPSPHWECPLHAVCTIDYRDSECLRSPWRKGGIEQACSYGLVARYLGIPDEYVPESMDADD